MSKNVTITQIHSQNRKQHLNLLQTLGDLASQENRPASQNMRFENWEKNSSSLTHTLVEQKRYDPPNGQFCITSIDGLPTAAGGCYLSDWSKNVMTIGVRTWTNPKFSDRWWHGDYFLPQQVQLARQIGCTAAVLTFNDYSQSLRIFLSRIASGKAVSFGSKNSEFYKDLIFYKQKFMIKNVPQTIAVKILSGSQQDFEQSALPPLYSCELDL